MSIDKNNNLPEGADVPSNLPQEAVELLDRFAERAALRRQCNDVIAGRSVLSAEDFGALMDKLSPDMEPELVEMYQSLREDLQQNFLGELQRIDANWCRLFFNPPFDNTDNDQGAILPLTSSQANRLREVLNYHPLKSPGVPKGE